jgi:pilus assembly protein CpaB
VNLLVTPEQAETLSLASNETRIQLVLRNPLDTQTAKVPGTAMASLFGGAPKPAAAPRPRPVTVAAKAPAHVPAAPPAVHAPPAAAPLPPYQVEVITGSKRTEVQFARPAEEKE